MKTLQEQISVVTAQALRDGCNPAVSVQEAVGQGDLLALRLASGSREMDVLAYLYLKTFADQRLMIAQKRYDNEQKKK